jgi:hypothetical protein
MFQKMNFLISWTTINFLMTLVPKLKHTKYISILLQGNEKNQLKIKWNKCITVFTNVTSNQISTVNILCPKLKLGIPQFKPYLYSKKLSQRVKSHKSFPLSPSVLPTQTHTIISSTFFLPLSIGQHTFSTTATAINCTWSKLVDGTEIAFSELTYNEEYLNLDYQCSQQMYLMGHASLYH